MRIKELLGKTVLDKDAKEIGKILDLDFDSSNGQINKIIVSLKKNMLSSEEITIDYNNIKSIGDYLLLDINIITE